MMRRRSCFTGCMAMALRWGSSGRFCSSSTTAAGLPQPHGKDADKPHGHHSKLTDDEMSFVAYAAAQPRVLMDFSDLLRVAKVVETEPSGEEWRQFCQHLGREGLVGLSGLSSLCETTPLGFFDMPAMKQLRLVYAKSALQIRQGKEEDLSSTTEASRVAEVIADIFYRHSLVAELFADSLKEFVTGNVKLAQSMRVVSAQHRQQLQQANHERLVGTSFKTPAGNSSAGAGSSAEAALSSTHIFVTTAAGERLAINSDILKFYDALQPFCEKFITLRATYRFLFSHFLRVQEARRRCIEATQQQGQKGVQQGAGGVSTSSASEGNRGPNVKIDWSVAKYGVDPKNPDLKQFGAFGYLNVLQVTQLAATEAREQANRRWPSLTLVNSLPTIDVGKAGGSSATAVPSLSSPFVPLIDLRLQGFSERRILTIPAGCFNCISAVISHALNGRCARIMSEWNTLLSLRSEQGGDSRREEELRRLERSIIKLFSMPIEVIVSQPADGPHVGLRIRDSLGDGLPLVLRPYTSHFIFAALAHPYDVSLNGRGVASIGEQHDTIDSHVTATNVHNTSSAATDAPATSSVASPTPGSFQSTVRGTDNKLYPKNMHDFSWSQSTIRVPYADCVMRNILGGYLDVSHIDHGPVTYYMHFPVDIVKAPPSKDRKVVGISPHSSKSRSLHSIM